ncbi:MAG TPA: DUF362 domain-containing protein [Terracidiphilus sp.]|nr:DUF362 domain-containing protein [Terracidiphilus sp.]
MESRREFLKTAATGALLLSSKSALGLGGAADHNAVKSRVVIARDAKVYSSPGQLDETRVVALLDRAVASWTGYNKPLDGWKRILGKDLGPDKVIGLKVNGLGGKGIATHPVLTKAVCERLQQAGIKPANIIIWEQRTRFLEACGFEHSDNPGSIRTLSSEIFGYEQNPQSFGSARVNLAKALTLCDMVIGLPILKDHSMAGVTFAMKNMYGVVERPFELHRDGCNPAVADLNCIPVVRQKVRFTIGDALSSVYDGGPGFRPERLWYPNALIVGEDRVALDSVAWQMIERKRSEVGMPTLESAGRPPRYIATAANAAHGLGTNEPGRMEVVEV